MSYGELHIKIPAGKSPRNGWAVPGAFVCGEKKRGVNLDK